MRVLDKAKDNFVAYIDREVKSFYLSANAILRIEGRSNGDAPTPRVQMCLNSDLYNWRHSNRDDRWSMIDERRRLRVAYNSIFRKVFG